MRDYDNQPTEITTVTGRDGKRVGIAWDQERNALPGTPLDWDLLRGRPPLQREADLAFGPLAVWQNAPRAVVQDGCPLNESSCEAKGKEAYGISMCDALN